MQPSKDPTANYSLLESEFANSRDALLQAIRAVLMQKGFAKTALSAETYNLLDTAFETCAEVGLPPRFVITELLQAIDTLEPDDTREEMLSIIIDIIDDAKRCQSLGADDPAV